MVTGNADFQGGDKARRRLGQADVRIKGAINRALRAVGRVIVPIMRAEAPRSGKRGGRAGQSLAASTRAQIKGGGLDQRLEIRQGARTREGVFYGRFVRQGTRPHEIRPVRANALRFEVGGEVVFAKKVNHPGTQPNRYHVRARDRAQPQVQQIAQREAVKLSEELL